MNAETVPLLERQNFIQRVHRADGCGSQRGNHRAHIALAQLGLQRLQAHAAAAVGGNRRNSNFSTAEMRW